MLLGKQFSFPKDTPPTGAIEPLSYFLISTSAKYSLQDPSSKVTVLKVLSCHISIFITTNKFPPLYVISWGKVCPDLIWTQDSNQQERIPGGVRGAGARHCIAGHWLTQHLTGWKDDGWCPAQVVPARHAAWVHVSWVLDVGVRTCTCVGLIIVTQ